MRYYYAIYKPYGLNQLNCGNGQGNRLYRFNKKQSRDNLIVDYPDKAKVLTRKEAQPLLNKANFWEYGVNCGYSFYHDSIDDGLKALSNECHRLINALPTSNLGMNVYKPRVLKAIDQALLNISEVSA